MSRPLVHNRAVFGFATLFLFGLAACAADNAAETAVETRMKKDITFLASEECEGRGVDTKGIQKAADYIVEEFKKAGLKPVDGQTSYFQPFPIAGSAKLDSPNTLVLHGPQGQEIALELNKQFRPMGMSGSGKLSAPLVFAGYGVTAKDIAYDDFKGVDVKGKIVVVVRRAPRATNPNAPFDGDRQQSHQALQTKITNAELNGAAAVLLVNDFDTAKNGDPLMEFSYGVNAAAPTSLLAAQVKRSVIDSILQSSLDAGLREIERDIDADLKPRSAPLTGWTANLEVKVRRSSLTANNIIGVIEGKGPLAKETVIIGAHYDHLGYGNFGSLGTKDQKGKAIHFGADDNGSGTTTIMELARRFGAKKDAEGRRLVFMTFSGEEKGLLGSEYYCKHPLIPVADTVAMVNLDMVGRLRADEKTKKDKLTVYGTATAKTFDKLIDSLNEKYQFQIKKVPGGMGPSDHASFYLRKIPVFFFFTNDHPDYHRPSDTADKINVAGMMKVADLTADLIEQLRTAPERPEYVKVTESSPRPGGPAGPRIGIRPDYDSDKEGVLIGGVVPGGPAEKAGLKDGDLITEVGGKPTKNLETYMVLMRNFKPGDKVPLTVMRDGKKQTITVVPE